MRSVVTIPVINGVAHIIHFDAQSGQTAVDGEVRYELDHPMPPPEDGEPGDVATVQGQDVSGKKSTAQEKEAATLLNEYVADANAQFVSHKEKYPLPSEGTTPIATLETVQDSPKALGSISSTSADGHGGEKVATANKLNKNNDHRDLKDDDLTPQPFSIPGDDEPKDEEGMESIGEQGDRTRSRVSAHHHHHHTVPQQHDAPRVPASQEQQQTGFTVEQGHRISSEPSLEDVTVIDKNPDMLEAAEQQETTLFAPSSPSLSIPARQNILAEIPDSPQEQHDSILNDESANKNNPITVPESLRTRGLVPSVVGAHHCTPQFCVNVSVTDDGQFATFHIERDMAHTGWIALGIGYAMTMADLIILWPTHTPNRGAVLSRRTTHAYIEPHLVGLDPHPSSDPLMSDRPSEASLYPPNEYILHNRNPLSVDLLGHPLVPGSSSTSHRKTSITPMTLFPQDPDGSKKFIVQFTRPLKTVNRAYKLTPGTEQDFCWAYSPKPVSPDSVQDPGAHITQHKSVGSFAMDVAANQPGLKDLIQRLKLEDEQEAAAEKERRKKEIEESNRKLAHEQPQPVVGAQPAREEGSKKVQLSEAQMAWMTAETVSGRNESPPSPLLN
ncbi:hypothetical protein BGZ70_008654 [Mortierella alpina]|uniref:DOMON domain-containing protein n=1 Tax=Mortierella alpina TaxID=64518 RepID=A0A9P6JFM1_MORAP|nr:hypothetical protein BGZ70_008654 [Mortierella alpina]